MTDLEKLYAYVTENAVIGSIDRGFYNGLPREKFTHGKLAVSDAAGKIVANLSVTGNNVEHVGINLVNRLIANEKLKTLVLSLT